VLYTENLCFSSRFGHIVFQIVENVYGIDSEMFD